MPRALGRRAVIVRAQEKVVVIGLAADSGQHTAVADLGGSHLMFYRLAQCQTLVLVFIKVGRCDGFPSWLAAVSHRPLRLVSPLQDAASPHS